MMALEEVINRKSEQAFGKQWPTHCCLALGYLSASCVAWKIAMSSEIYAITIVAAILWFLPFPLEVLRTADCLAILRKSSGQYRGLDIRKEALSNILWDRYGETTFGALWFSMAALACIISIGFAKL